MKKVLLSLLFTASLTAQTALVSADLKNALGTFVPARARVTLRLKNYGTSIPRVTSGPLAGVIVAPTVTANSDEHRASRDAPSCFAQP